MRRLVYPVAPTNPVTVITLPAEITKSNKARSIPLTPAIVESLTYLKLVSVNGRLFPFKEGTAWYLWTNIRDDLGAKGMDLSDAVLHTMRHTCLTRLAKRLPIHIVSEWAGHANIQITAKTYTHLDVGDLMAGLDVLS